MLFFCKLPPRVTEIAQTMGVRKSTHGQLSFCRCVPKTYPVLGKLACVLVWKGICLQCSWHLPCKRCILGCLFHLKTHPVVVLFRCFCLHLVNNFRFGKGLCSVGCNNTRLFFGNQFQAIFHFVYIFCAYLLTLCVNRRII